MKSAKIGQVFTGANNSTAKVTAVDTTSITLQINNTNNPYYGKKVVVGATAENETKDATFKIVKMEGTGVTLEVTNKKSPFYNKKFAVGESIDTQNGKTEIREITDESLVIAQYHPMVGKTLFFDVEVVEIK
jgi:FKBP-type peptidyl-prolyl cis-trans isomerase 2